MTVDEKINRFEESIKVFTNQIERFIDTPGVGLSSFILTCCLIDTVANYTIATRKAPNNVTYKKFIADYLGQVNSDYDDDDVKTRIYKGIRCSLVHKFTIESGILLGELKNKALHNTFDTDQNYILDLRSFYEDVKKAITDYLLPEIKTNPTMQKRFLKIFKRNRLFAVYQTVEVYEGDPMVLSGETINPNRAKYEEIVFKNH